MAEVLNDDANAKKYADLSEEIRKAFMKEFVDKDGVIQGNTQAGYALALAHEMLPESLRDSAFHHMLTSLETYDYRISTGFLSTICLMNELARRGRPEIAYRLLESHRFPSWLYQIDQGATTVWERWDGYVKGRGFQDPGMNSFNHYAIGSVGEWLYGSVLGIQPDDRHPGFREFFIRPAIDGTLTWAKGKYHSIMGDIVSEWRVEGEILHMHLEIPANTVARVSVPSTDARTISESGTPAGKTTGVTLISTDGGAGVFEVGSGVYDFAAPLRRK
jgi:alpha-L-rhamnosidase